MTLGSLFDGIGGWQLAAIHNGVTPIWSSEIEPFPCAVTKKHFPDTLQLGDITKLNGAELPPVDIICAGSPCQDLSVAGKQEGLKGARSGLFMDAIKLVRDMRRASGGKSPRYFVWENVPGAFSSNKGMDFRAVLEEITEAEIPMPDGGKWADAGVVEWDGGSLAWRILDAQYWGVPQRRRRIFLVADFGGGSAGEILFERESVRWDSSESGEAGEGLAAGVESGVGSASIVRMRAGCAGGGKGALISREKSLSLLNHNEQVLFVPDKARSLTARNDGSPCVDRGPDIIAAGVVSKGNGEAWLTPEQHTSLTSGGGQAGQGYPCVMTAAGFKIGNSEAAHSIGYEVETSPTLSAMDSGNKPAVAVYDMTHADEVMRPVDGDKVQTLNARMGTGGNQVPVLAYREGSFGQYEKTDVAATTKAVGGVLGGGSETFVCGGETNATKGNEILRVLREAYGEKAVCEWCTAILERVQQTDILRQGVHEEGVQSETAHGDKLDDDSLPCAESIAEWLLRDLREREERGRTSQGRESAEQRQSKLNAGVQELPHETPQSAKEMCDMWRQTQGAWLLLQALTAFQKIRESTNLQSGRQAKTVRRLTPLEAERLQGLPDGYTLIDDKTCSDTARYKALGNGMAQPCADYVIRRIREATT